MVQAWKPERAHHDSVLGRCVLKMDHYWWASRHLGPAWKYDNRKRFDVRGTLPPGSGTLLWHVHNAPTATLQRVVLGNPFS